jgi:hypothetical protein
LPAFLFTTHRYHGGFLLLFPDQGYQFGFDRRLILSPVNPPFNAVATDDVLAANTTAWYFA